MLDPVPSMTFLTLAAAGRWRDAEQELGALAMLVTPDEFALFEDMLEGRRNCRRIADSLFLLDGDDEVASDAIDAQVFIAGATGCRPLVLLEPVPSAAPTHVRVMASGLGHVLLGQFGRDDRRAALVHEFAHCVAISGVMFLDEGFATLLEMDYAGQRPHPQRWKRPTLAALLEMDWSQDPHFELLDAPTPDAPYELAAWLVARLRAFAGLPALVDVIRGLRQRRSTVDIGAVLGRATGLFPDMLDREMFDAPGDLLPDGAVFLAEGEAAAARNALPELRAAAVHGRDGAAANLAKAALTLGITSFDGEGQLARAEASAWTKRQADTGLPSPLLAAYGYVLLSFSAESPIERRTAGARAAQRFAEIAVEDAGPEELIAAAKAQTYAPQLFLPAHEWRRRLSDLAGDPRFGAAAGRLLTHERFTRETALC